MGDFLDNYLVAESILRRLIIYYAADTSRKESDSLQTVQINASLKHFSLTVSNGMDAPTRNGINVPKW
ncbi:hypothetical protein ACVBEH_16330, partial [Roseateles sp. GG27B]